MTNKVSMKSVMTSTAGSAADAFSCANTGLVLLMDVAIAASIFAAFIVILALALNFVLSLISASLIMLISLLALLSLLAILCMSHCLKR